MKIIIAVILAAAIFTGCKKNGVTPATTTKTTTVDSTKALTPDQVIHTVVFNAGPQFVKTSISNQTLTMQFTENVNLYVTADGYGTASAVHLFENFQNSQLNGIDYTTVNATGNTTFDWVDDNLNNVTTKTVSDTTVGGVAVKKIAVTRPFTFSKKYGSAQEATDQQALLLTNKFTDKVVFSAFCYYNNVTYPTNSVSVAMVYTK